MSYIAGYIVKLSTEREKVLSDSFYDAFAEPVSEFRHSRNIPLVCFIVNSNLFVTHIALGKRGVRAGTDLRRLNLIDFFSVDPFISSDIIISEVPNRFKIIIENKCKYGGYLPPKSFNAFMQAVVQLAPSTREILSRYSENRSRRIANIPPHNKKILAEQKEAIGTAMTIAGIDRVELQDWDINEETQTISFLDGLKQVRLREDPMVINDLNNLPGSEIIKTAPHASVVFENDQSKLTVVLANRLPLEKQLGVDLIYYNETFSCFIMVQYKAMEKENDNLVYRFPNEQLTEEIERMNQVLSKLEEYTDDQAEADSFRLSQNPFFLKICPRIVFDPDNIGLIKGMYLPLGYWDVLSEHPSMLGPRGGRRLSYKNVRRYFDNTSFVSLVSGGWIGTNIKQSVLLKEVIRTTLETGRSLVFAVKTDKHLRNQ